ncbi:MAG: transporter substrate-binding domain-containing protein [Parachlamydia sp.]|nr:transporter substrate-binding domain-containing protein [Parachlamydia sp.]
MNYLIFCICTLLLSSPLAAKELVIGTTSGYAPYVSLDERGEYVGFDIDFANELAKKLDRTLVIKDLGSMPSLFLSLKQGKIDAIIWAISITEERQKQVEMIYYQGQTINSLPLLFWKAIPEGVTSIDKMGPQRLISVEAGSFQESFLKTIPGLNLKQVDKVMDALMEIKYGKSAATLIDPFLLPTLLPQFPEVQVLEVPLPPSEQSFGNGIALNKKNQALIAEVRKTVDELRQEGKIRALESKWKLGGM